MSRNLRLSLVTETYFPQVNGVSRTLDRLVRHCAEAGDRIQLLLPRYDQEAVKMSPQVEKRDFGSFPLPFYKEVVLPVVTVGMIEQALRDFRPDLVHIATEGPLGWAALRAAHRQQLPVVTSYHTNFPQYLQNYRLRFMEPLCWRYLRWFHNQTLATFCPSASTRQLIQNMGFRNVGLWSRGVDSNRFQPNKRDHTLRASLGIGPDDLLLTYAGRMANEKNLEMLIGAWQQLSAHDNSHLLFIGDGPLRQRLEENKLPRILFAGYRYGEELATLYASSDIFVFPSLSETFGNVVLEAMASGLPVVAYDVQGPKDIIRHRQTGLLVNSVDAESLAGAMQALIVDREMRLQLGHQARTYSQTQTWQKIMRTMRDHYIACLATPKSSHPGQIRAGRFVA